MGTGEGNGGYELRFSVFAKTLTGPCHKSPYLSAGLDPPRAWPGLGNGLGPDTWGGADLSTKSGTGRASTLVLGTWSLGGPVSGGRCDILCAFGTSGIVFCPHQVLCGSRTCAPHFGLGCVRWWAVSVPRTSDYGFLDSLDGYWTLRRSWTGLGAQPDSNQGSFSTPPRISLTVRNVR